MSRNIIKLIVSQCLSRFGDNIEYIALCILCYHITGNVISIGIISILSAIPNIAFTLVGGAISERVNKKKLMYNVEMLRCIFILSIPILGYFNILNIIYIL